MNREKKCKFRAHFEVEKKMRGNSSGPGSDRCSVSCVYLSQSNARSKRLRERSYNQVVWVLTEAACRLISRLFIPGSVAFFPTLRRPADGQKNKVEPTKKSRYPNRSTGLNPPSTTRGAGLGCSVSSFFLKKNKLLFRFKDYLMGRVFRAQKVTQFQVA